MYYYPIRNNNYYYKNRGYNNRIIPGAGGFFLPFTLGFLTAPLVLPPRPQPYYNPRPPYYGPTYYY